MAGVRPRRAADRSPAHAAPSRWEGIRRNSVDGLLWTLGGLGLLSLLAAVCAHVFGFSIVLFSTGSMSPTIPAGSAALVRLLPAGEFKVGDVTTVERANALPITHRITSIKSLSGSATEREITMRGDANDVDDPEPYVMADARLVVASIPGVASAIAGCRNPRVMGLLSLLAAGLVTWAFWPRQARKATIVAAAALVAGSQLLGAQDAHAAQAEYQVIGRHLALTVIADSGAMSSMMPNATVLWNVGIATIGDEEGLIHIGVGLVPEAVNAAAIDVAVLACPVRWVGSECAGPSRAWVVDAALDQAFLATSQSDTKELGTTDAGVPVWVQVRATLKQQTSDVNATLKLAAWGGGEMVDATSDGDGSGNGSSLAYTGSDGLFETLALGGAAIGTGLVVARLAGRRQRRETDREVAL